MKNGEFRIIIENLRFETIIGILDFEREKTQKVVVNSKILYSGDFVDYAKVCEIIENEMKREKFLLIEDALEYLINFLKREFPQIEEIFLQIKKPDILKNAEIGVEILRKF